MSAFLAALANVAGFCMLVGPLHLIAWLFGGRASFVQVAYTLAAIISPLTLCTALVILPALIPGLGSLGAFTLVFLLLGCQLVLTMIAVNAIHRIGWVWAAVAVLVPALFIGIATFLVIFAPLLGELLGIW
jgi:hypothetical protein